MKGLLALFISEFPFVIYILILAQFFVNRAVTVHDV
jgi:hypothetical protein